MYPTKLPEEKRTRYLKIINQTAKSLGYNFKEITFSPLKSKKIMFTHSSGLVVHFGDPDYSDFIIYKLLGDKMAHKHRERYLSRASKMKGDWKSNKYSPNNLAMKLLWAS